MKKLLALLFLIASSQAAIAQSVLSDPHGTVNGPLVVTTTIKTGGYTVSGLPSGTVGMRAYVTDQLTTCAVAGATLTGGGSVICPVFYNGSAWVGD